MSRSDTDRLAGATRRAGERVPLYVHVLTLAVVAQFVSGSSDRYGMPLPPDRVLLALGLLLLLTHPDLRRAGLRLQGIHVLMAAVVAWCIGSMIWFGPLNDTAAMFALLDAIGLIPFAFFLLAPLVYATRARRHVLLRALTVLGFYLGYVSVAQGLHLYSLVLPPGIVDPSHPHFGRALGPSLQVASNGLALLACTYPSAVYAARSRGLRRVFGAVASALCVAGAFFTLTRSIWLALVLGAGAVLLAERRARGPLLLVGALAAVTVVGVLSVAPALQGSVTERAQTSRSVYDRLNANAAAVRVVLAEPMQGVGLNRFHEVESDWVWQNPEYPITNMGIDVHNVLLGHAAELGLPGVTMWLLTLSFAGLAAWRGPRLRDGPLQDWRVAALAYAVAWWTVAMLVPIKYAFPTTMLWLGLGLVADHRRLGWQHLPGVEAGPLPPGGGPPPGEGPPPDSAPPARRADWTARRHARDVNDLSHTTDTSDRNEVRA